MKKNEERKQQLKLHRETLKALTPDEHEQVFGGLMHLITDPTECPSDCYGWTNTGCV